ncbi:hypothetical protein EV385_4398 [Krasilnikovia cinnamomea]|uniref:Uncharacterized protein n=1 Tax=Krasilnikovia cinnamomea TaxID=349313 RepID=A0A4Q7ZNC0_9ACTN|nr:hypothetical protein [Krasilnikovia cinnamomea]RZU52532.1 hypothetical protein EV385_4398 [Krasilnikovia cinnamomea]
MAKLPIYCSRCGDLATVEITACTADSSRSATACAKHRPAVRRWAAHVAQPVITPIDQPQAGQLALFPPTEWR